MTDFNPDVVFNAGAPIDVNKLNQLQRNISSIYENNSSMLNLTNTTVGGIQKEIRVFPIVDVGQAEVKVNGNSVQFAFKNTNFTKAPTIVATIASNLSTETSYSVRATSDNERSARVEVVSTNLKATSQTVIVNWIAIEMKTIDF
jgi:hypothetical protein